MGGKNYFKISNLIKYKILERGKQPYLEYVLFFKWINNYNYRLTNNEVIEQVPKGLRPSKPSQCPSNFILYFWINLLDQIWELMQQCWDQDENKRPSFTEILSKLEGFIKSNSNNLTSNYELSPNQYNLYPPNLSISSKDNYFSKSEVKQD